MKSHNGYRSKAAYSVALWLANDNELYTAALFALKRAQVMNEFNQGRFYQGRPLAYHAAVLLLPLLPERTPDGARYSISNVQGALEGFYGEFHPARIDVNSL